MIAFIINVELPFYFELEDMQDYEYEFHFCNFSMFKISFLEDSDMRCASRKIIIYGIYDDIDCSRYQLKEIRKTLKQEADVYRVNLPEKVRDQLLMEVNKNLNSITSYLQEEKNGIWIEQISLATIGNGYNKSVKYSFYTPNFKFGVNVQEQSGYECGIHQIPLSECIFDRFDYDINYNEPQKKYLIKAERAIYNGEYEEFIVYASIAVEAFSDKYISDIVQNDKKDIVLECIKSVNYDYLNKYYNVLLKYIVGISLFEYNAGYYSDLKAMYSIRNALMHSGMIADKDIRAAGLSKLGYKECIKILASIKETFKWMSSMKNRPS